MNRWMLGGVVVVACVGIGVHFAMQQNEPVTPASQPEAKPVVAAAPAAPPAAVVLAEVVELTDLDPLLDPPARPVTGVPFEAEAPTVRVSAPATAFIPPAVD